MEDVKTIEDRVAILEHLVNDVLIGGLKKANDEYIDEDNYKKFKENYDVMLEPYVEPMKAICGEDDYDLSRDLYDFTKKQDGYGKEGFDERSIVETAINNIKERIAAIKGVDEKDVDVDVKVDVEKTEDVPEDKEEEIPSEEQLAAELAEALA